MTPRLFLAIAALVTAANITAQEVANKFTASGGIQSDILIPVKDHAASTDDCKEWGLTNTYADMALRSNHIDAGVRFEFTRFPLPGYATSPEQDFKGWGVPHFWVKSHYRNWELTLGTYYEQFGSGFIMRTYQERSLGIDNSLLGGRLAVRPYHGIQIKGLVGKQRRYWKWNKSWICGLDAELNIDQWIPCMQEHGTGLSLGASWVNKYQSPDNDDIMVDATHKLRLPAYVNAFDVRAELQSAGFDLLAECAWKTHDPQFHNHYIYRTGHVAMLSASYSTRGLSVLAQAKRSDDMTFRSDRSIPGISSNINNMPAFTTEHTYTLPAFYPYATRPEGEWAFQGEAGYKPKGRHASEIKLCYSHVFALGKHDASGVQAGTDGYRAAYFKCGPTYYRDLNIQYGRKYSPRFHLSLMYMNQYYNNGKLKTIEREDHRDVEDVLNHIFVADGKWTMHRRLTLRAEAQYMKSSQASCGQFFAWNSRGAQGDWVFALAELSVRPRWMFTLSDLCNIGETGRHYYNGFVTFTHSAHRLQLGYGRTRPGYNCTGGVCRWIPGSKGVSLSYNYNF